MGTEVRWQMKSEAEPGSSGPVTIDFMGSCLGMSAESKELDLDLHVPTGWEKRLDLQSGKVYIQRCITPSSATYPKNKFPTNQTAPSCSNFHQEIAPNLDLKLFSNSPSNVLPIHENATYESVCTLEKVRSALERAKKVSSPPTTSSYKKRASPSDSDSSMISVTNNNNNNDELNSSSRNVNRVDNRTMVAGACPSCLMYVLIAKTNPRCPRCNSFVTTQAKRLKIDLNL